MRLSDYVSTRFVLCILAVPALAGCGSGGGDGLFLVSEVGNTAAGFAPVNGNQVSVPLQQEDNGSVSVAGVGLAAYVIGFTSNADSARAFAGIADGASVGNTVTSGTASYQARYNYSFVSNVATTSSGIQATFNNLRSDQSISLSANFDSGTLSGTSNLLTVNGTIQGSNLGGNVRMTPNGRFSSGSISGTLTGSIGNTGVIGAFAGADGSRAGAGGFVGTRQ